jgi:hypothetical protein
MGTKTTRPSSVRGGPKPAGHGHQKRTTASSGAKSRPFRIEQRPSPKDWSEDELLTLEEAAALFWPDGPLHISL